MIISPLLGLLISFSQQTLFIKRWVLIIFITISGSIYYFYETADGYRHQENIYIHYVEMSAFQFWEHVGDVLTFKHNPLLQPDLYYHGIAYFVGAILNAPRLFFVIISFVFAYFYIGTLFKVIQLVPFYKYNWMFYSFITCLVLWKGVEGINTVRTWTGLWVLAYGLISYFETKKYKYLILIFCVPFIHFSYYIMAIPAWLVLFFGSKPKLYSLLFILSFFVSIINPESATDSLSETELGERKVRSYGVEEEQTSDVLINEFQQSGLNWYLVYGRSGINIWGVKILALILIFRGYYNSRMTFFESKIFSIGLLTMVLSSSAWFIYALAARSAVVGGLFILMAFVMLAQRGAFNRYGGKMGLLEKYLFLFVLLLFIPFVVLRIAEIIGFTSIFIVVFPFIVWINPDWNIPINQAIKFLINF